MLSSLFDVGGVFGGILAGHISDHLDARAITASIFMYCAIPALFLYHAYGSISLFYNAAPMISTSRKQHSNVFLLILFKFNEI
ncbi:putative glycerol-3-phosphate transporter 1 [Platanthera zijinensis]|uniref:Glycerol-3-phosphate transporter 1 n=1 Tax=Platanthera zijinensis TaxID=2320716 RepID=A0AAP0FZX4_9ASPA